MAIMTAAATTTTRTTIEPMCSLTIDCRCATSSEGTTRYQWPSTIAPHAPPSSATELRKLATVSSGISPGASPRDLESPAASTAASPHTIAVHSSAGRILASIRPMVAQYTTSAASAMSSSADRRRCRAFGSSSFGPQGEPDRDEQRRGAGVEAKKLHPCLAADPGQNEGNADA